MPQQPVCSHASVLPPAEVIWYYTDGTTETTTEDFATPAGLMRFAARAEELGFGPRREIARRLRNMWRADLDPGWILPLDGDRRSHLERLEPESP